jgi:hypothetical protein
MDAREAMETGTLCSHCGGPTDDSPFAVWLSGLDEDWKLPVCRSCQSLRQNGQLPVDLLIQQWAYMRSGERAPYTAEYEMVLIRLDCLGCGAAFQFDQASTGVGSAVAAAGAAAQRMPDGSLSMVCSWCGRTNLLERHGDQLVTVRLW